jgi:putative tryptophan/tyrosine transport system substrate-binding protein
MEATMTRRTFGFLVTLALGLLVAPLAAPAPPPKVYRVGVLQSGSPPPDPYWKERSLLVQELRRLGWREGENLTLDYRWSAGGGPGADLVAELVQRPVDVIVATNSILIRAVQQATTTNPVVMLSVGDPVAEGFITSHAQPGHNITGVDLSFVPELSGKLLELLREAAPTVTRIAVLVHPSLRSTGHMLEALEGAARVLGVQSHVLAVSHPRDLEPAFRTAVRDGSGALLVLPSVLFAIHQSHLATLTVRHRLPAIFWQRAFVRAGGLMSYGPSSAATWQRMAYYVDRLLKGAKPADLPVERPATFELIINLKTAQLLGLTIPPMLLFQATDVIR